MVVPFSYLLSAARIQSVKRDRPRLLFRPSGTLRQKKRERKEDEGEGVFYCLVNTKRCALRGGEGERSMKSVSTVGFFAHLCLF